MEFQVIVKQRDVWVDQADPRFKIESPKLDGTVKRGSVTCPCCGYTTPVAHVREQLKARRGGAKDARLLCVVVSRPTEQGRFYRLETKSDLQAVEDASCELEQRRKVHRGPIPIVPNEPISHNELRRISVPIYGMGSWGDVFSDRQSLALSTLARLGSDVRRRSDPDLCEVLAVVLALGVGRQADACSTLARWHTTGKKAGAFGRQALGMVWDYCEINPLSSSTGSWGGVVEWIVKVCVFQANLDCTSNGQAHRATATANPLSDDMASAWITDPPYYDAVPYAHLSDYFYV